MTEHPIQGLMRTAMENVRQMVDANTIVGDPITTPDGTLILPISKVGFGFAAGGSEFTMEHEEEKRERGVTPYESKATSATAFPFGGGSGGGVSITPIAFLVVGTHGVKVVPLDHSTRLFERLIESAPQVIDRLQSLFGGTRPPQESEPFHDVTVAAPDEPIPTRSL